MSVPDQIKSLNCDISKYTKAPRSKDFHTTVNMCKLFVYLAMLGHANRWSTNGHFEVVVVDVRSNLSGSHHDHLGPVIDNIVNFNNASRGVSKACVRYDASPLLSAA